MIISRKKSTWMAMIFAFIYILWIGIAPSLVALSRKYLAVNKDKPSDLPVDC